jgi:hypothetical protein
MEQGEFLVNVLFFKRVMKCIQDHKCSLCGEVILKGSSYFYSLDPDPTTARFLKYCVQCFDQRLDRPTTLSTEKRLDR